MKWSPARLDRLVSPDCLLHQIAPLLIVFLTDRFLHRRIICYVTCVAVLLLPGMALKHWICHSGLYLPYEVHTTKSC